MKGTEFFKNPKRETSDICKSLEYDKSDLSNPWETDGSLRNNEGQLAYYLAKNKVGRMPYTSPE